MLFVVPLIEPLQPGRVGAHLGEHHRFSEPIAHLMRESIAPAIGKCFRGRLRMAQTKEGRLRSCSMSNPATDLYRSEISLSSFGEITLSILSKGFPPLRSCTSRRIASGGFLRFIKTTFVVAATLTSSYSFKAPSFSPLRLKQPVR